jgi:HSP20 family protein
VRVERASVIVGRNTTRGVTMATLARRDRGGFDLSDLWRRFFEVSPETEGWLRVEERRDGDDFVVRFEIPGIDPDHDVELTVLDGILHIRARREERSERDEEGGYHSEFRYGSFVRNVALPPGVAEDDIRATYKDGILEVRIPSGSEEKSEAKRIPITRE